MINVSDLSKAYGGRYLFRRVTFQLQPGKRYGLVGANGTGKSTLLRIMSGDESTDSGVVAIGKDVRVGTLKQDHYLYENETLINTVIQGNKVLWKALKRKDILLNGEEFTEDDCNELEELEKVLETHQGYAAESLAARLLVGLGLKSETHNQPMSALSGGYKLRVLLAQTLFAVPEVLLLDEPNNHLDIVSIKWLEQHLQQYRGAVMVSSHDRDFLNTVCTDIADLDYGTVRLYPGNYDQFIGAKALARELQEAQLSKQEKRKEDMQGFVDRFRSKASKARQAQSRVKMIEKLEVEMEQLDLQPSSRSYPRLRFSMDRPSGVMALKAQHIGKAYGTHVVLNGVSFEVERAERIGIIGPNGIGKSTLLKILTDTLPADEGSYQWGHAASISYFSQDHDSQLEGGRTLLDWLTASEPTVSEQACRDALGRSLFSGDDVLKQISMLSGGEKARLILARIMLQQRNVLVFDEPTNHLDMEAIDKLVEALAEYPGTLIFVSHNVYFVTKLANRIFEIQPCGIRDFRGTYPEYLATFDTDFLSKEATPRSLQAPQAPKVEATQPVDIEERRKQRNRRNQLKKEVDTLEALSAKLEGQIAELEAIMAQDSFYAKDTTEVNSIVQRKAKLEAELHDCVLKWEQAAREQDS